MLSFMGCARRRVIACTLVLAGAAAGLPPATASTGNTPLIDFFAGEGCAIGPSTRKLAMEAGFEAEAIDALIETARADPESIETGEWVVLSAASCEIRPPRVVSELRLDDPEIRSRISGIDAYVADGDPGCFLDADNLYEELMVTRGWLPDKSLQEHLSLLTEHLVSGELAFYTADILRSPAGFQLTSGSCAQVPDIEQIRRSHQVLIDNFDRLIRADMQNAVCETDGSPSWQAGELFHELTSGESSNAWMAMEMRFILMGSGWIEGITLEDRGMPRPPLCTYE